MNRIRGKILTSFLVVITILVISTGSFLYLNFITITNYERIMGNIVSEYELIVKTQALTESFNDLVKYSDDSERLNTFTEHKNKLTELLEHLNSSIEDEESFSIYFGTRNILNGIIREAELGIDAMSVRDYSKVDKYQESINNKNLFVKENTANLLLSEARSLEEIQRDIINIRILTQIIATVIVIASVIFSIFYAFRFSGNLTKPLERLSLTARNIISGKTDVEVDKKIMKGNDEISSLAISFNRMLSYLRSNIIQLKLERNKLRQYLDVAGIFVIVFSMDNKLMTINKKGQEIFGPSDEALSKDWVSIFVDKKDKTKTKKILRLTSTEITTNSTVENKIITFKGEKRNVVWHFSPLKDDKGNVSSLLGTGVDITELVKAKLKIGQLKELNELKSEVMNIATHELKTPLISIVGLSEVMKNNPKEIPTEYKEYISIINSEGQKLNNLIKTMLFSSRNELGEVALNLESIDIEEMISSLKPSLEMLTERSDSNLEIKNNFKKEKITSDKEKISQVIYNLVDNAVKYGPKNQTIKIIFSTEKEDKLKVEVINKGKGISKELQKKLFIKFSQLEPSLSRSQDGMGLGLYICKQNIDALGGEIGVSSEINKGANFYFIIPTEGKGNAGEETAPVGSS
jgi:PAS domain S-box-containing protein